MQKDRLSSRGTRAYWNSVGGSYRWQVELLYQVRPLLITGDNSSFWHFPCFFISNEIADESIHSVHDFSQAVLTILPGYLHNFLSDLGLKAMKSLGQCCVYLVLNYCCLICSASEAVTSHQPFEPSSQPGFFFEFLNIC